MTALSRVEAVWGQIFPGRELLWNDWKPVVRSTVDQAGPIEYSGNQMSDGEKAALYLAGRVFSAASGILIIDEPETHLHTLLAIRLWDVLEKERPDLRFVYITHDLGFALSRTQTRYVLASPLHGLKVLDLKEDLPGDVAEVLLGSASLSFYASRVVFTEGTTTSIDDELFGAWFHARDTVVRGVGSCEMVNRCTDALAQSGIATSLTAVGIVDGDYHADEYLSSRSTRIHALGVHEVEGLLALPEVLAAVAKHQGQDCDFDVYASKLRASVTSSDRHRVVVERWKRRVEPAVVGVTRRVSNREKPLDDLLAEVTDTFDQSKWDFSPVSMLQDEKTRVESATEISDLLRLMPAKAFVSVAAGMVGMTRKAYKDLVVAALAVKQGPLMDLHTELVVVLGPYLPSRTV